MFRGGAGVRNSPAFSQGFMQRSCRSSSETSSKQGLTNHDPGFLQRCPVDAHIRIAWESWLIPQNQSLRGWVGSECVSACFLSGFSVNFTLDPACHLSFLISRATCWLLLDSVTITFHESPLEKPTRPKTRGLKAGRCDGREEDLKRVDALEPAISGPSWWPNHSSPLVAKAELLCHFFFCVIFELV